MTGSMNCFAVELLCLAIGHHAHSIADERVFDDCADHRCAGGPVPQPKRNLELFNYPTFASYVADELLVTCERNAATADPAQTVVTGSSAGVAFSAYAASRRPDVFGNVPSQSGTFWP